MTVAEHPAAHPTIASASGRKPEHERDARAMPPVLLRPRPTPRSRARSPSKTPDAAAPDENTDLRRPADASLDHRPRP